jgi:hypothetical protein
MQASRKQATIIVAIIILLLFTLFEAREHYKGFSAYLGIKFATKKLLWDSNLYLLLR